MRFRSEREYILILAGAALPEVKKDPDASKTGLKLIISRKNHYKNATF